MQPEPGARQLRLLRPLGGPKLLLPPDAAAAAGGPQTRRWLAAGVHSKARDAKRDLPPLRRVQPLLRVGARAVDGLHLRLLSRARTRRLEEAQANKFDLVARKLGPAARACGCSTSAAAGAAWCMHAAREYGVKALGVTLSAAAGRVGADRRSSEAGLSELAEVRHLDYRDVPETGFDAVSSIGLTEHIGKAQLPAYFSFLYGKLRPGGRLLNHCITRPDNSEPAVRKRRVHQPVRLPRRRARGPRLPDLAACTTPASRCGTRRTCASTTP